MNILNIRIELKNPFDRWDYFKNLGSISGDVGLYKAWELEHTYYSPMLFDADIRWTYQTDHAGIEITVGLFGYGVHFHIYDIRHWDHDKNAYVKTYY